MYILDLDKAASANTTYKYSFEKATKCEHANNAIVIYQGWKKSSPTLIWEVGWMANGGYTLVCGFATSWIWWLHTSLRLCYKLNILMLAEICYKRQNCTEQIATESTVTKSHITTIKKQNPCHKTLRTILTFHQICFRQEHGETMMTYQSGNRSTHQNHSLHDVQNQQTDPAETDDTEPKGEGQSAVIIQAL